ncbi:MAG TPA: DEAD/DEAH box helicase family protein [Nitrososphaerales archaeon]
MMEKPLIRFDKGTLIIKGSFRAPYTTYDNRLKVFRAQAIYYQEILDYFTRSRVEFKDDALDLVPSPFMKSTVNLRKYQTEALSKWAESGKRGVIVLPTGSGKTIIAIKSIEMVNEPAIVIVPTLDLVDQWRNKLQEEFKIEVGVIGGGLFDLKAITVSTYDSAYIRAGEIGNKFKLIIFDECHHLPAEGYRQIAEMFIAPYRLGLTATYEREDGLHKELPRLIGGVVYCLKPDDLTGEYLSDYNLERVTVEMKDDEKAEYNVNFKIFKDYLKKNGLVLRGPQDLMRIIWRSNRDSEARKAILARSRAISISFNSASKIEALRNILNENPKERTIIFTQHNSLVHRISSEFLIPYITHKTPKEERSETLKLFKEGTYITIVTSRVLDEGIDIPEVSLGVIMSGSGSSREFIQRLGRLLRKKEGKTAKLIEIITNQTSESRVSWRRKRGLTTQ